MSKASLHRAKLAELRALRQSGKKVFDSYTVDDADNLYDEVDEDGYKKIVRDRLNQDDFVVDDNGQGYADDGREDWDRVQRYDSDSDVDDMPARGRPSKAGLHPLIPSPAKSLFKPVSNGTINTAKKTRQDDQAKRDANDRNISEYFTKGAGKTQPKPKVQSTYCPRPDLSAVKLTCARAIAGQDQGR